MTLVAAGQLTSTNNLLHNLGLVKTLISKAIASKARILFLPEATDYIATSVAESLSLVHPVETGPLITGIQKELKAHSSSHTPSLLDVVVGIHEPTIGGKRVKNTLLYIDSNGVILKRYQKIHLFDVDVENGPILRESTSVEPGNEILSPFDTPAGKLGLSICYDLRFPELALRLRSLGAQILTFPSAFTVRTGQAHWELLARARAVDTQSYVIMPAQVGTHDPGTGKRVSYGHALIVDPWGTVISHTDVNILDPQLAIADIDLEGIEKVRQNMPLWEQRRPDVFGYKV